MIFSAIIQFNKIFIYNSIVSLAYGVINIIALFNKKLKLFVTGRKESFHKLRTIESSDKVLWFHAASLGEFEQARPIIESLKKDYSNYKIVVTFFSPSGYEVRKNYPHADVICYLPFDTKSNIRNYGIITYKSMLRHYTHTLTLKLIW